MDERAPKTPDELDQGYCMNARTTILTSYAEWTVLSALRSRAPIKNRNDVYGLIAKLMFDEVINKSHGPIQQREFDAWHRRTLNGIVLGHSRMANQYGWAAKIVNVYLKTYCYVADGGREGIRNCLHPPIDSGLWKGVRRNFKHDNKTLADIQRVKTIAAIDSYEKYERIVRGLKAVAEKVSCSLIEVEQFWEKA